MAFIGRTGMDAVKRTGGMTMNYDDNEYAYVIAECRPTNDDDQYASILINGDGYIFTHVQPVKDMQAAYSVMTDIDRNRPDNTFIVLHHQSLAQLFDGITGKEVTYYE